MTEGDGTDIQKILNEPMPEGAREVLDRLEDAPTLTKVKAKDAKKFFKGMEPDPEMVEHL